MADAVSGGALVLALLWCVPALALLGRLTDVAGAVLALLLWLLVVAYLLRLLRRRLQGFTGDTLGATQQLSELALYLGIALGLA